MGKFPVDLDKEGNLVSVTINTLLSTRPCPKSAFRKLVRALLKDNLYSAC